MSKQYIELDLEIVAMTPDAILFTDGDYEVWVPRSQVADGVDYWEEDIGLSKEFEITEWFAEKEMLI
jgi:hypothetical protein